LALCRSGRAGKALALPAAETVTVAAGEEFARAIVNKGGVVQLSLVLEAGARRPSMCSTPPMPMPASKSK
jgi:hypothetical protein